MNRVTYPLSAATCQLKRTAAVVRAALLRVLGVPDYDGYVAHFAAAHPERTPLPHTQFVRERLDARYSRPGARCC